MKARNSEQTKTISDLKLASASLNKEVNEQAESIEGLQEDVRDNTLLVTNLRTPPFLGPKGILIGVFWDILRSKITPKIGGLPIMGRSNRKIN